MQAPTQSGHPSFVATEHVYDLRLRDGSSNTFYAVASRFADETLAVVESRASQFLDGYIRHIQGRRAEPLRSRGEYALDLLTLGMALATYEEQALQTPLWAIKLARALCWLRRRSPLLKPLANAARAALNRRLLAPSVCAKTSPAGGALDRIPCLIQWMRATGEFEQEAARLKCLQGFFATLQADVASHCVQIIQEIFRNFSCDADLALGVYTQGVPKFLAIEYASRTYREDEIFCGRTPAEYHLNMVAAEVMNRGLREAFERTVRKVVLVPTCMRGAHAAECKARVSGVDMTCTACDPDCAVHRITRRMARLGVRVYLVPHSSGFSRWLERWQREPGVGVTAVGCMLNILPGGYEMRSRHIASQCVPLDYPGCKKHWDSKGISTAMNEDRLVEIIAASRS